jgi:hypothetical protein
MLRTSAFRGNGERIMFEFLYLPISDFNKPSSSQTIDMPIHVAAELSIQATAIKTTIDFNNACERVCYDKQTTK